MKCPGFPNPSNHVCDILGVTVYYWNIFNIENTESKTNSSILK